MTFGTLLSSQGTDASFVLTRETLSGFPPGSFPSVLRFQLYQIRFPFRSRFGIHFRWPLGAFAFRRVHYVSGFPLSLIIEFRGFEFRHADTPNKPPLRGSRR
ncbi:hypothetical protein DXZ75_15930 [Streptomyces sp. AcE210]|nr:hypothetical protein DXZ75_15930 [Streptomyces sp. AcE210]